jgi:hypothetical protein
MDIKWEAITRNAMLFAVVGAVLFAAVFGFLGQSIEVADYVLLGALSGALVGASVSVVVGVAEQERIRHVGDVVSAAWTTINAIIGMLAGAITALIAVIVLVPATGCGCDTRSLSLFAWGVFLARLVGAPLGVVLGLIIGASWRRVRFS